MASDLLKDLMKKADQRRLVLPDFQRDFVWKPSDVIKLLSSLLNGYPIGGLLFMENSGVYGFRLLDGVPGTVDRERAAEAILILDGQQRLTSCYRAFYGALEVQDYPGRFYFNYKDYIENSDISGSEVENFVEFRRAKDVKRTLSTTADEQAAGLFPLDIIFRAPRGTDYSSWLSGYTFSKAKGDHSLFNRFSQIQSKFIRNFIEPITSYQVHYEQIKKDTSSDVICTVFEAINTTGKRLTVFDLLVARCFPEDVRLRDWLQVALTRPLIRRFDETGDELCVTMLPRIIALLSKKSCKRGDMLDLKPSTIRDYWQQAVDALDMALRALSDRFGCVGLRFMPMADIVAPLALVLVSDKFRDSAEQWQKISRWYWRAVFSQFYSSSPDTKVARTVREFLGNGTPGWLEDDGREPESVRDFSYRSTLLDDVSRIDAALYRGVMSMLLANDAADWGKDGRRLRSVNWQEIEDHHIYPVRFLGPYGIKGQAVNNIANRTPLFSTTNAAISNDAPHVYLENPAIVGGRGITVEVLQRHCVSRDLLKTPFSKEAYEVFLKDRKARLMALIKELVGTEPLADDN